MSQPRYPLLPLPPLAPAACLTCNRHSDPLGFFDLGVDLDFGGRVYLCATDVLEMAQQLGMALVSARQQREQVDQLAGLRVALVTAQEEARQLRTVLEVGALGMIENVLMERLRLDLAALGPPGSEQEEGEPGGGSEPGAGAAGGDGGGKPGDGGGGDVRPPVRRTPRSRNRAPAGPDAGDAGSGPGPAAEPPAGAVPAAAGHADQHVAGAAAGA